MRISRKRGSWILQFANENRTCVTGAPRPVRLMSAYGTKRISPTRRAMSAFGVLSSNDRVSQSPAAPFGVNPCRYL